MRKYQDNVQVRSTQQRTARQTVSPDVTPSPRGRTQQILQLQRTLGNRKVGQLLQSQRLTPQGRLVGVQPKLMVGAANNQYEQEADRVARQVMNTSDAVAANSMQRAMSPEEDEDQMLQPKPLAASITPFVQRQMVNNEEPEDKEKPVQAKFLTETSREPLQRQPETEEEEETEPIQAKSAGTLSDTFEAGADVETQVSLSKGRGSPLPDPVRAYMEPRFGADFSHVRVHSGSDALQMNHAVGAQAFTHGSDIYFGAGKSPTDLSLTAHELTHVVQQGGAGPLQPSRLEASSTPEMSHRLQRYAGIQFGLNIAKPKLPAVSTSLSKEFTATVSAKSAGMPVLAPPVPSPTVSSGGASLPVGGKTEVGNKAPVIEGANALTTGKAKDQEALSEAETDAVSSEAASLSTNASPAGEQQSRSTSEAVPAEKGNAQAEAVPGAVDAKAPSKPAAESAGTPAEKAKEGSVKDKGGAEGSKVGEVSESTEAGADGAARPKTPDEDPRFQAFKGQTRVTAAKAKAHAPASAKAAEAQGAAQGPANEVASQAKDAQVEEMAAQKPGTFDKQAFIDAVEKAIKAAAPKDLEEVSEFSESGKAGEVKDKVAGMVTQNKEAAEKNIKEKTKADPDLSKGKAKEVTLMSDEEPGPKPGPVGAAAAMPPPATAAEVNLDKGPADINKAMAEEDVTEDQLRESNEPEMIQAADAKNEAEKHSAEAPVAYRTEEASILGAAKGKAQQAAVAGIGKMHASKVGALVRVTEAKNTTKSADETKRAKVATDMEEIYGKTKTDVTKILDGIEPKVTKAFETGEKNARQVFESFVEAKMSAYKEERYSGLRGKGRWIRDKFMDLPDEVNEFYEQGKRQYLTAMGRVISQVADVVDKDLTAARNRIAQGLVEIQKYVVSLPKDLKQVGKQAAKEIGEKFKQLENDVVSKQEELVSMIANKYVESRDALDKRIEELKEANKGLVSKAMDFVEGAIDTIRKLKDLLMTVLRKAISVITDIIRHPIQFIENFMSGVKDGLNLFTDKIGDYLESALIGWLFGPSVLGDRQIEKPESLDFKGVVSLVLQVLGLTKDAILDLLRNKVGAPAVEKLKQGVEWVTMLAEEGPGGLWKWIQEKAGDLYDTVIGGIKDFVVTRIIRAGITWLISLLNPAGALVKIVKAIVDVVTFIFERAEQIADFINAILDAVIAVAKGDTGGVAKKIADGLGKGLSLAIGFLASLLGLGGIGETVRGIIDKVRAPIKRVVNGLIDGAVRQAKRLLKIVKKAGKAVAQVGVPKDPNERLRLAVQASVSAARRLTGRVTQALLNPILAGIKVRYGLQALQPYEQGGTWWVRAAINPERRGNTEVPTTTPVSQTGSEPISSANREQLKVDASKAMAEEAAAGLTPNQVPAAIERVKRRTLVSISAQPQSNGNIRVSFRANDENVLLGELRATLTSGSHTVESATRIRLVANHPITDLASILPREIPPGGKYPSSPTGGGTVRVQGNEIQMLTWNTHPLGQTTESHAEAHTVTAFESNPAKEALKYIESIEIQNFDYSACKSCSSALAGMLKQICAAQRENKQIVIKRAEIYWTALYATEVETYRPDETTWSEIEKLVKAGWTIHVPHSALPDPRAENKIAEQVYKRPLHLEFVVIEGTIHC
jgi:hypothetical protein